MSHARIKTVFLHFSNNLPWSIFYCCSCSKTWFSWNFHVSCCCYLHLLLLSLSCHQKTAANLLCAKTVVILTRIVSVYVRMELILAPKMTQVRMTVSIKFLYDVGFIQWMTSCHKNHMTIRVIILWRLSVTPLTTSVSIMRFLLEITFILRAIKSHFKGSYDKQNLTLAVISYGLYETYRRLV